MSKLKSALKALRHGTFFRILKNRLFPVDSSLEIKNGRIAYWTEVTKKRLHDLKVNPLSAEEEEEVKDFWNDYNVNLVFHEFYKSATGIFDVRNIPDDIYYTYIDPYFSDWSLGSIFDNKTYYKLWFRDVKQPELVCYRRSGFWYDKYDKIVPKDLILNRIAHSDGVFIKKACGSMGGHGIAVIEKGISSSKVGEVILALGDEKEDIVVQECVQQCSELSKLNESSVNTIRIMTFLRKDGTVKVCSAILRMGLAGSRVDNASSGGITIGIESSGRLKDVAFAPNGKSFKKHPSSYVNFSSIIVPNFGNVINLVSEQAAKFPEFRLISWDIAIDRDNLPVLIEANLFVGELEFHQLNNGPIFGDETKDILDEILSHPKQIKYPFN